MSIIPDYAQQTLELSRQIESQAQVTAQIWSDRKRVDFYNQYIDYYLKWLDNYLHGQEICGKGLNDLLQFVSDKVDEFEDAAQSSISGDIVAPDYACGGAPVSGGSHQIMASTSVSSHDVNHAIPNSDVPDEQSPEEISRNRYNQTVDYNLNSPGSFNPESLRKILNRRRNG